MNGAIRIATTAWARTAAHLARVAWLASVTAFLCAGCGASAPVSSDPAVSRAVEKVVRASPAVSASQAESRAQDHLLKGEWALAEAAALDARRADEGSYVAPLVLAEVRARTAQWDAALSFAEQAFDAGRSQGLSALEAADWYVRLAVRSGRGKQGLAWIDSKLAEDPESLELGVLRQYALNAAGQSAVVQKEARELLVRDETNIGVMHALAQSYLAQGKLPQARFVLERALEVQPDAAAILLALAGVAQSEGELREAIGLLEKAVEIDPRSAELRNAIGTLYQRMGDNQGARAHLERAVEVAPGFAEAWLNLASAHRGLKDYAQAEQLYRKALLLDSSLGAAHHNLAVLYLESPVDGYEPQERLEKSIVEWKAYGQYVTTSDEKTEVERSIEEARKLIEVEQQRREQQLKTDGADPS